MTREMTTRRNLLLSLVALPFVPVALRDALASSDAATTKSEGTAGAFATQRIRLPAGATCITLLHASHRQDKPDDIDLVVRTDAGTVCARIDRAVPCAITDSEDVPIILLSWDAPDAPALWKLEAASGWCVDWKMAEGIYWRAL